jgi:hypothetical protein
MAGTPIKAKALPGGFPQFKRHLAAIHRMPPTHASTRPFHVSDVVYAMLRHGIGKSLVRRTGSTPTADMAVQNRAVRGGAKSPQKLTSNVLWGSILKKPY